MTLLGRVIKKDEMHLLLMGVGEYYERGIDDMGDPQDRVALWKNVFIPYLLIPFRGKKLGHALARGLIQLLEYDADPGLALYSLSGTLLDYYYLKQDRRISFPLPIHEISEKIRDTLASRRSLLVNDCRWAGANIYSQCGLWYPIVRSLTRVRDEFAGSDLVPLRAGCVD